MAHARGLAKPARLVGVCVWTGVRHRVRGADQPANRAARRRRPGGAPAQCKDRADDGLSVCLGSYVPTPNRFSRRAWRSCKRPLRSCRMGRPARRGPPPRPSPPSRRWCVCFLLSRGLAPTVSAFFVGQVFGKLAFPVANLFCIGSPVGLFLTLRGTTTASKAAVTRGWRPSVGAVSLPQSHVNAGLDRRADCLARGRAHLQHLSPPGPDRKDLLWPEGISAFIHFSRPGVSPGPARHRQRPARSGGPCVRPVGGPFRPWRTLTPHFPCRVPGTRRTAFSRPSSTRSRRRGKAC